MNLSRRQFLAATSSALALRFTLRAPGAATAQDFAPSVYLRITANDTVTLWVARFEVGQGVRTLLPMLLAEELEVDLDRVVVEQAEPGGKWQGVQMHTSGSDSSRDSFRVLRVAGATARAMLIAAAAAHWNVEPATCRARSGAVLHAASNRRLSYGELADAASRLPVPAAPPLKPPTEYRVLGRPRRRQDGLAIVTGAARFGLDVRVPDMLSASIERAPTLGARLLRFDATAALNVPGVRRVLPVKSGIHPGVAVLADDHWSAMRGRTALKIEWQAGGHAAFDSERFRAAMRQDHAAATAYAVRHEGNATAALAGATRRHAATYSWPFQAHASVETLNCTATVRDGRCEVWLPTQTDVRTLAAIARVTGLANDRITMHPMLVGGGFGRRLFADFAAEAVELSAQVQRPVQVLWTRQDDLRHGYFNPATIEQFTAGLHADGTVAAFVHRTSNSELTIYSIHDGVDLWAAKAKAEKPADVYASEESPWGAFDNPYALPALAVDCVDVTSPVPTGPWRAVMYPSTVFGRESFVDELAHLAGADPIAYRLGLLPAGQQRLGNGNIDRGRLLHVLEVVRERSSWATRLPSDDKFVRGRGVAASVFHGQSYLAMVAEVAVARDLSSLRVERIVTAVDCGIALNPLGVDGQTESGIAWGLTATLHGKIDFRAGAAVQSTYEDYRVLRCDEMPALTTVLVDSGAPPGGYGEHPVPLVAPAVANAVFAACGRRVRDLPITAAALQRG